MNISQDRPENAKSGENFLEVLLFQMAGSALYAINVFKVREAIPSPTITHVPGTHPAVVGVAYLREQAISVLDLGQVMGQAPLTDREDTYVIVTEFNRSIQGFLVKKVDRILYLDWAQVEIPPYHNDSQGYVGSIAWQDQQLIQILDVEKLILDTLGEPDLTVDDTVKALADGLDDSVMRVMLVDDSHVAQQQIMKILEKVGISCVVFDNGKSALEQLARWAEQGDLYQRIAMLITDIEMPKMDGITLVKEARKIPQLKDLHILMHSSLARIEDMTAVKKSGANDYLEKFDTQELLSKVLKQLKKQA